MCQKTASSHTSRGRRPRLTARRQRLAEQYLPMAHNMARPWKKRLPFAWEEFESAACMALVEAAKTFQPKYGVKFSTFARYRIRGALLNARRKWLSYHRRFRHDEIPRFSAMPHLAPDSNGRELMVDPSPEVGSELEAVEQVETWLRKLPRGHAAACRQIYLHGKSITETAQVMNLSLARVSFMHTEALTMLNGTWGQNSRGTPEPSPN